MSHKCCKECQKLLPIASFSKHSGSRDRLQYKCKTCLASKSKLWYENNKLRALRVAKQYYENNKQNISAYQKEWYSENAEHCKKRSIEYNRENKSKRRIRHRTRLKSDINFKLRCNLRGRLGKALVNNHKSGSAVRDLGCTIPQLRKYLESKFQPGMTWDNYGRNGWHIDHVKPLALYDLSDPKEIKLATHYTNLQPLWAKDNLSKGVRHESQ